MLLERSISHSCKERDQRCELAAIGFGNQQPAGPRSLTFLPTALLYALTCASRNLPDHLGSVFPTFELNDPRKFEF